VNALRHFLLALQYFTRIPLPEGVARWVGFDSAMQRASLAYLPLVGALVGAVGGACLLGLLRGLPAVGASTWVAAVLSTLVTVMLTGAFHEDGLADLADGLGGHVSRERALEIMKDSRIGSYGAIALVLVFLLKIGLIAALAQADAVSAAWVLFAAHACSRLMPVGVAALLPNIRDAAASKSQAVTAGVGWRVIGGAVFWALLALAMAVWRHPGLIWLGGVAACLLAWLIMCRFLRRRLQGYTGDALGATQQVCELAFYLGLLFCLPAGALT
jgi:adenosylcobinamide-GDP ribazoletransferase